MPKLSYGKKPRVIETKLDHDAVDVSEEKFRAAVDTIVGVGGIARGSAIAFLEYQWYRLPSAGRRRPGGRRPTALNETVLQRMRTFRKEGNSEAKVVARILEEIENGGIVGPDDRRGLSERTLKRRYIPVVFEWPEQRWVLRIACGGD